MVIQLGLSASLLAGRIAPGQCLKSSTFMASLSLRQSGRTQSDPRQELMHAVIFPSSGLLDVSEKLQEEQL
jgi:hypothetical protein